ncbi:MAG: RNA pyrophosphohydrolase [Micavibrio aeruginosavorus]|uniref:RNA pyrophosphohydrolase n=1 Tax=Micavibrio aeruginosavorus TaxID=349221 RepID=A0A2W5Q0F9_9BACT|nr:MAG: RNA pyrophosphohydrolase [Micavibrio aeruginosavorus]
MSDNLPYRPCVGLCLFNGSGKVFVGERLDSAGAWQMPQGGVDEGEDIKTAALRELLEEIGTDKAEIIRIHGKPLRYDIPEDVRARISWGRQYRGQEQTWVALRFMGDENDIKLDAWEHPEFARYQWVALADVPKMIVPFKISTYEHVVEAFKDIA